MNQLFVIEGVFVCFDNFGCYCLNDLYCVVGSEECYKFKYWYVI